MFGRINREQRALHNTMAQLWRFSVTALLLSLLVACSDQNLGDLQNYVSDIKARKGRIEPLPVFEPIPQFVYRSDDLKDPFATWKAEVAPVAKNNSSGLFPDAQREREELEAFPLDTLRMMGILEMKGVRWGLVKDSDGIVHRVKSGNYIGQNFGKIKTIGPDSIGVIEIVPNGLGGWERREASLTLNME